MVGSKTVRISLITGFVALCLSVYGQQRTLSSQYMYNIYEHNPAYAGLDRSLSVTAMYRSQWTGLLGSPTTAYVNAHLPWYIWNGALGVELYSDRLGPQLNSSFAMSYNYVQGYSLGLFSVGARFGLFQSRIDGSIVRTPQGDYESVINHNDPRLSNTIERGLGLTYEVGIYSASSTWDAGLTISRLPTSRVMVGPSEVALAPHGLAFFQYKYRWSDDLIIKPSVLVRADQSSVQTDIAVMAEMSGSVFGGVGLRGYDSSSFDALVFTAGLTINENYRLIYSFDTGLSNIKRVNQGTHELTLNYNLRQVIGAGLNPPIIYNPRNL